MIYKIQVRQVPVISDWHGYRFI